MKFVMDNIFLVAVAVVSGAMLVWPLLRRGAGGPSVTTLEATQMINRQDALLLDVREQAEYAQAHILNARGLPLSQLEARIGDIEKFKDKPLDRVLRHRQSFEYSRRNAEKARLFQRGHSERRFCGLAASRSAGAEIGAFMPTIRMYSTAVCPFCQRAEMLLKSKGVAEIEKIRVDLDSARRDEMIQKTGRRTVPQIYIGAVHVGGFDDLAALDRAGKLDALLLGQT